MRRFPLVLSLAAAFVPGWAGCNWTIDDNAPEFPLVGSPPSLSSLQKLNKGPVLNSAIVRGKDAAWWLALQEENNKLRVVRLSPPESEITIAGDQFVIRSRAFFVWILGDKPADPKMPRPATLRILSAGDPSPPIEYVFDQGVGQLVIGGGDEVFAYAATTADTHSYELIRKNGSFRRTIPYQMVEGADPVGLDRAFYSGDGEIFFDRAPCSAGCDDPSGDDPHGLERRNTIAHFTREERDLDLGPLPRRILLYEPSRARRQLISCGSDGLRIVPVEESAVNPALLLDPSPCASGLFSLLGVTQPDGTRRLQLYYMIGEELRTVPIDGSAPPVSALDRKVERVLGVYADGKVLYSQDPADRYIYGVGDAWFGDWRFAERARLIYVSRDNKKVRFLEHAARAGGIGDLLSAPFDGTPTRLARNVFQYDELDDGRLLAASNHAFRGIQNRIIVLDEERGEARWVVDQAARYGFIPDSDDLLVDIVTGASTADLYRVPVPPADRTDGGQAP